MEIRKYLYSISGTCYYNYICISGDTVSFETYLNDNKECYTGKKTTIELYELAVVLSELNNCTYCEALTDSVVMELLKNVPCRLVTEITKGQLYINKRIGRSSGSACEIYRMFIRREDDRIDVYHFTTEEINNIRQLLLIHLSK